MCQLLILDYDSSSDDRKLHINWFIVHTLYSSHLYYIIYSTGNTRSSVQILIDNLNNICLYFYNLRSINYN